MHLSRCYLEDTVILLEEDAFGGGLCAGRGDLEVTPSTPIPSLPTSFLPPTLERAESGCTRDTRCAVHPPLRVCAAGWGWRRSPEGGRARYEFLNQRLAGSTACSSCAFQLPCPQAGWQRRCRLAPVCSQLGVQQRGWGPAQTLLAHVQEPCCTDRNGSERHVP